MIKKVLTISLALVLTIALSIGGTLAYLSYQDDDVNVMTLGNVKIKQHEYERLLKDDGAYSMVTSEKYGEGYEVREFTQAKPLYPATGEVTGWGGIVPFDQIKGASGSQAVLDGLNNVQDKFVLVENTGKSDAYVRTIFAFELGSVDAEKWSDIIMLNINDSHWTWYWIGVTEIEGNNYYLAEAIYKGAASRHTDGILPAGEYTYNSLAQVYMTSAATNEDVEAIDGNKNATYDILVFSHAVQVKGFENADESFDAVAPIAEESVPAKSSAEIALDIAFYDITVDDHPWKEKSIDWTGTGVVSYAAGVYNSTLKSGTFTLVNDINTSDSERHYNGNREYAITSGRDYTINLNGYTINHDGVYQDGKNTGYTYLFTVAHENSKLTINGEGTITSSNAEGAVSIVYNQSGTQTIINGGDFRPNKGVAVWAGNGSRITINGGSFVSTGSDEELIYSSGGIIDIYGGFFHNTGWENRPVNVANANRGTGVINIYGGTFVNFDPSTGGDDPSNILVADGYKVVSETQANGDIWYSVVPE